MPSVSMFIWFCSSFLHTEFLNKKHLCHLISPHQTLCFASNKAGEALLQGFYF